MASRENNVITTNNTKHTIRARSRIWYLYFLTLLLALLSFARKKLNCKSVTSFHALRYKTYLRVDVRYDATLGDDDIAKKFVQSILRSLSTQRTGKVD
jgi:hypothetical protein